MKNILANVPRQLAEELTETILQHESVRIERIVSTGHSSDEGFWYDQDEHEWVVVLQGKARLEFDDGKAIEMEPGDSVHIAAHQRHRVQWTSPDGPTVWLAVFYS